MFLNFDNLLYSSATVVNSRKEKSVKASFSADNKNIYSLAASNSFNIMGKKGASLKTSFDVNTPTNKPLISFKGNGDYIVDKTVKLDSSISILPLFKKPASFKCKYLNKSQRIYIYHLYLYFTATNHVPCHSLVACKSLQPLELCQ